MPAGPCPGRSFPAPGFPERRGGPSPHLGDPVMGLLLPPPADGTCPLAPQGGAPSDLPLPAEHCCGGEGEDGRKEGSGSIAPPHSSPPVFSSPALVSLSQQLRGGVGPSSLLGGARPESKLRDSSPSCGVPEPDSYPTHFPNHPSVGLWSWWCLSGHGTKSLCPFFI